MEFKLGKGPWQAIFQGTFQEHEMEILHNPESVLLVVIYDKENDSRAGAILECFKVFSAEGELEGFIDNAKTDSLTIIKHSQGQDYAFFLLSASPTYANYEEESMQKEIDFLIDSVNNNARIVKGMAIAADIKLKELHSCSPEIQKAFFSQPLTLASLYAVKETSQKKHAGIEEIKIEETLTAGVILLGLGKDNKPVKEPVALFEKTIVEGGKEEERMHAVRVIVESALLSKATVVLLDQKKLFSGMSNPTTETKELQKFGVQFEPIGFPVKEFKVPDEVRVQISMLNPKGLADAIGLGEGETLDALMEIMKNAEYDSIEALVNAVESKSIAQKVPEYQKARVARVLRLIDIRYPGLFNGKNNIPEISKEWAKGLGRAAIIDLSGKDDRAMLLVAHSVVKGMLEHFKEKGKTKTLRAIIFLPKAHHILPAMSTNYLVKEISESLWQLKAYGVGFLIETEHETEVSEETVKITEATISIINGHDAGIQLKGKRNYRVKLRPTLSKS